MTEAVSYALYCVGQEGCLSLVSYMVRSQLLLVKTTIPHDNRRGRWEPLLYTKFLINAMREHKPAKLLLYLPLIKKEGDSPYSAAWLNVCALSPLGMRLNGACHPWLATFSKNRTCCCTGQCRAAGEDPGVWNRGLTPPPLRIYIYSNLPATIIASY